jgi:ketosteroid isomerase-like protein
MPTKPVSLEQRVQRLEDIEAIRTLKSRYHTLVNDTQFEKVGDLFTMDAALNLGYLMPDGKTIIGREAISAAFVAMKTAKSQSQLKQFLHNHIVEIEGEDAASGTGLLLACYGVKEESFVVAGKYMEHYRRVDGAWLFRRMELALYFTVPLKTGWAEHKRHYLINSGESIPEYKELLPNPPVAP